MEGKIKSMQRDHKMAETALSDQIAAKKEQKDIEQVVSAKILEYFTAKNDILKDEAEAVDKKKEKKLNSLQEETTAIEEAKVDAENEMVQVKIKVQNEQLEKRKRDDKDKEEEERELEKLRKKAEQEKAAKYI